MLECSRAGRGRPGEWRGAGKRKGEGQAFALPREFKPLLRSAVFGIMTAALLSSPAESPEVIIADLLEAEAEAGPLPDVACACVYRAVVWQFEVSEGAGDAARLLSLLPHPPFRAARHSPSPTRGGHGGQATTCRVTGRIGGQFCALRPRIYPLLLSRLFLARSVAEANARLCSA